jgi:hypothetical protein
MLADPKRPGGQQRGDPSMAGVMQALIAPPELQVLRVAHKLLQLE